MYSLSTSFCVSSRELVARDALLLADELVEQQQHRRRRVDRHRRRDLIERDRVEGRAHVVDRVDGHPGAADLAQAARVVGVQAELRGQVEGHRQAGRSVREQVAVALVGLLGRRVARATGASSTAACGIHLAMHAARVGKGARLAQAQILREVLLGVERLDLDPESVKRRGSSGPTMGATVRRSSVAIAAKVKSRAPARSRSCSAQSRVPRYSARARQRPTAVAPRAKVPCPPPTWTFTVRDVTCQPNSGSRRSTVTRAVPATPGLTCTAPPPARERDACRGDRPRRAQQDVAGVDAGAGGHRHEVATGRRGG